MTFRYGFGKNERLKSRKQIDELFASGNSYPAFPLRMAWRLFPANAGAPSGLLAGVSASKRHFKKATDRNRIKRLLREAYRLQKPELLELLQAQGLSGHVFFLYTGKELPSFTEVETALRKCLHQLTRKAHEAIS